MHLVRQNLREKKKVASQNRSRYRISLCGFPLAPLLMLTTLCTSRVFLELKKKLKLCIPMPFYTRTHVRIPEEPTTPVRESKLKYTQKTLALNHKILGHF